MYPTAVLRDCWNPQQWSFHLLPKRYWRYSHLQWSFLVAALLLQSLHATDTRRCPTPQQPHFWSSNPADSGSSRLLFRAHLEFYLESAMQFSSAAKLMSSWTISREIYTMADRQMPILSSSIFQSHLQLIPQQKTCRLKQQYIRTSCNWSRISFLCRSITT